MPTVRIVEEKFIRFAKRSAATSLDIQNGKLQNLKKIKNESFSLLFVRVVRSMRLKNLTFFQLVI